MAFLPPENMQYVVSETDTVKRQQQFGKKCGVHLLLLLLSSSSSSSSLSLVYYPF
jgi:hypothetical protein